MQTSTVDQTSSRVISARPSNTERSIARIGPEEQTQLLEGARFHSAARTDDRDVVAQLLDLGQDVAGQQHRGTALGDLLDAYLKCLLHQRIQADGWQEDIYELLERHEAPIESASPNHEERFLVELNVGSLNVFVVVWRVNLGAVPLYLMDTDVDENQHGDRELSARLSEANFVYRRQLCRNRP